MLRQGRTGDSNNVAPGMNWRQQQIGPSYVKLDLTNFEERWTWNKPKYQRCCTNVELGIATKETNQKTQPGGINFNDFKGHEQGL